MSKISEEEIRRHLELLSRIQPSAQSANRAIQRVRRVLTEHEEAPKRKNISIWRIIMKNPVVKIAVAAAVVLACLAGLYFWTSTQSGVALADVLEKVEQMQAFMYKMKMVMTGAMPGMPAGKFEMETAVTSSNTYGTRMDVTMTDPTGRRDKITQQVYFLPNRKVQITIMPEQKQYQRMELDDNMPAKMKKQNNDPREQNNDPREQNNDPREQNNDPREMIKRIMNGKYSDMGRSEIDGVEVEGFRTTHATLGAMEDANIVLWVDAEKRLPVRMEIDFKMGEQIQVRSVIYDYQWDISVDANDFEPVIPEGFTSSTVKAPSISEEAAIEGLKSFADILGHYPKKLNIMDPSREFVAFIQELAGTNSTGEALKLGEKIKAAGLKLKDELKELKEEELKELAKLPEEEKIKKIMEKIELPEEEKIKIKKIMENKEILEKIGRMDMMRQIQSLVMFYTTLVQEKKEPAYYGETVTPADTDKVLLRWKISDSEYRVIFGDLRAETVTPEKLAELEAALPK
jgi:hypothetical protein